MPTPRRRVLEPIDRLSEILFGLIMTLTFTGSLSVAQAGRDDVRAMLVGALGCNIAWGLIDALLFAMGALAARSQNLRALVTARQAGDPDAARAALTDALPAAVAAVLTPQELDDVNRRLRAQPVLPHRARLDRETWLAALGVFLLVVLVTFPVAIPFLFMSEAHAALRVSNLIATVLLFVTGFMFARLTGRGPWLMGGLMVVVGTALAGLTMALGG